MIYVHGLAPEMSNRPGLSGHENTDVMKDLGIRSLLSTFYSVIKTLLVVFDRLQLLHQLTCAEGKEFLQKWKTCPSEFRDSYI